MAVGAHEDSQAFAPALLRRLGSRLVEVATSPDYDPEGCEAWAAVQATCVEAELALADLGDRPIRNRALCGRRPDELAARVAESGFSLELMIRLFEHGSGNVELRRKRDGVVYTPAWVTEYIVEHTVGARLRELRAELGLADALGPGAGDALRRYAATLDELAVVDPACGAGSFLLAAFERIVAQRRLVAVELERVTGARGLFEPRAAAAATLERNLHGVDRDRESVDFTRLLLRLRAAVPSRALVDNIRRGDALVSDDFDWARGYPRVFARPDPGFDCVIGNPPYVKLQQLRKQQEQVANYLVRAKTDAGAPVYESAQTGNFDLYLPFIEKGVGLLRGTGKLGYVAPSVWLLSEYGEGLRRFVRRTRSLARWIDFEGYQVFADATTYTALQLFSKRPQERIRCSFAPRGPADLPGLDDDEASSSIAYARLPETGPWRLLPPAKLALWDKLQAGCRTLAQSCREISVGVQTSADPIYHLRRVAAGRYLHGPGKRAQEVELEDAIMRPLISGAEANRYEQPSTHTYVLFPYAIAEGRASLIPAATMRERFPRAWAYLQTHEAALRRRERSKMDRDDRWWGYNYPKNLAKQHLPKLLVAQTVPALRVAYDETGRHCLNNVRVNGVFCDDPEQAWFLLGILNAPVADFVFRAIAKRKVGGYFEANKQFIAPLPIPDASPEQRASIAERARRLQALHTARARVDAARVDESIAAAEAEINARIYGLYRLSAAEIALIEAG